MMQMANNSTGDIESTFPIDYVTKAIAKHLAVMDDLSC